MRLTRDDPEALHYYAYLDGERLKYCIEADEEAGRAVILERPPAGKMKSWRRIEVRGKVELRRIEGT